MLVQTSNDKEELFSMFAINPPSEISTEDLEVC
jgi:hypothetical protein